MNKDEKIKIAEINEIADRLLRTASMFDEIRQIAVEKPEHIPDVHDVATEIRPAVIDCGTAILKSLYKVDSDVALLVAKKLADLVLRKKENPS